MKRIIQSLKVKANKNKKILLFTLGLSMIGVISGSIFLLIISNPDKSFVSSYIISFIEQIKEGSLSYLELFKNSFFTSFIYSILIFLFGISIVGIPIIYLLYFIRSFIIGFSISAFFLAYSYKGIIYAFFYMIPHFFNLFFYTVLVIFAYKISILLIQSLCSKKEVSLKKCFSNYVTYYILVVTFIFTSSIFETFAVPFILRYF